MTPEPLLLEVRCTLPDCGRWHWAFLPDGSAEPDGPFECSRCGEMTAMPVAPEPMETP